MVVRAIAELNDAPRGRPTEVDEAASVELIERVSSAYRSQVTLLAPVVNQLAGFVPQRRKRKLHIGLFGYSRKIQGVNGVSLPRAISFCAALYSVGLPPEILGLNALSEGDFDILDESYKNFRNDLADALRYYSDDCASVLPREVLAQLKPVICRLQSELDLANGPETDEHAALVRQIIDAYAKNRTRELQELIVDAARVRKFLG